MATACEYDYLIVGAGLFGAVVARELTDAGKRCLVIDRRPHVAGNCFTERRGGVDVHRYGAHIFHTKSARIWEYVERFARFNAYVHRVRVRYGDRLYSFPISLRTLGEVWSVHTRPEALARLEAARVPCVDPGDLESYALSQMGEELYRIFIAGYTEKQWGRRPSDLPASILRRIPLRLDDEDDRYFDDPYQGIPVDGYTAMVERMLAGIEVRVGVDFSGDRPYFRELAGRIVYSGPIDQLFACDRGRLAYRSLRFEVEERPGTFQACAVVNYGEARVPWTRIIEHKHFLPAPADGTVITREFPAPYTGENEPYYPIEDAANAKLAEEYRARAQAAGIVTGGRLGAYRYYDMHQVIGQALATAGTLIAGRNP